MTQITMRLINHTLEAGEPVPSGAHHSAVFVLSGALQIGEQTVEAGDGAYVAKGATNAAVERCEALVFAVDTNPDACGPQTSGCLVLDSRFELTDGEVFLRLDQISFPPGASAYRHVHPGAGIRYLTNGHLEIHTVHGVDPMDRGNAWFEDANSPVRADASPTDPTAFIRAMVLPIEYLGKPTISYLDRADDDKPRLQTNRRIFDQPIDF